MADLLSRLYHFRRIPTTVLKSCSRETSLIFLIPVQLLKGYQSWNFYIKLYHYHIPVPYSMLWKSQENFLKMLSACILHRFWFCLNQWSNLFPLGTCLLKPWKIIQLFILKITNKMTHIKSIMTMEFPVALNAIDTHVMTFELHNNHTENNSIF